MELLITIGLTAGLIWIGWQDFRARQVYLVSYLAVFALLGLKWVLGISPEPGYILTNFLITGMLAVMLALDNARTSSALYSLSHKIHASFHRTRLFFYKYHKDK